MSRGIAMWIDMARYKLHRTKALEGKFQEGKAFVYLIHGFIPSSVQFNRSVGSNSLRFHGLWHARLSCTSPTVGVCSNSCPSSWWCHPTISSFVVPFASYLQSSPASGSLQMIQFFTSCGQSIGVSASASVLPMNIQDWFPLGLTSLISLQPKGLSRVFSNTTVQKLKEGWALKNLFQLTNQIQQHIKKNHIPWPNGIYL